MPEPARTAVNHDAHLVLSEPERRGDALVVDLGDLLNLQEVIGRTEAADLPEAPFTCALAHLLHVRVVDGAAVLAAPQVALLAVPLLHGVPGTVLQQPLQLPLTAQLPDASGPRPARGRPAEAVHDRFQYGLQGTPIAVRRQQPYAARDVEADTAR
jgi:hypothetical protein